jgi:hypothetical protein
MTVPNVNIKELEDHVRFKTEIWASQGGWEFIDSVHVRFCKKVQSKPKITVKGSLNWQCWAVSVRDKLYKFRLRYM